MQGQIVETKKQTDQQQADAVKKTSDDATVVLNKQIAADKVAQDAAVKAAVKETTDRANKPLLFGFGGIALLSTVGLGVGIYIDITAKTDLLKSVGKGIAVACPIILAVSIGVIVAVEVIGTQIVPLGIILLVSFGAVAFTGTGMLVYVLIRERGILQTGVGELAAKVETPVALTVPTAKVVKKITATATPKVTAPAPVVAA